MLTRNCHHDLSRGSAPAWPQQKGQRHGCKRQNPNKQVKNGFVGEFKRVKHAGSGLTGLYDF